MTHKRTTIEMNEKLDFLLTDHGVDFEPSKPNLNPLALFHEKADALLVAHNCDIPEGEKNVAGLQPKLNLLIQGHGAEFDDSDLDPNALDTVTKKLDVLEQAHGA